MMSVVCRVVCIALRMPFAVYCLGFVSGVCSLLFNACCVMFVVRCLFCGACCSLFVVRCELFVVCCVLRVVC